MDRSFAARLTRPFGAPARRRPTAGGRGAGTGRARTAPARAPLGGLLGTGRVRLAALSHRRRMRVALVSALVALPLLAGGWLLLRDSPLVTVQHVRVSGVHGPEAGAIEAALAGAAHHMSTLDVKPGALRAAVAPFRVVREVRAVPSFPHGLSIHVVEQPPVAALTVAGSRTAVAADGVVLGPALLSSALPTVAASAEPAVGERVKGSGLLASLSVLGAAPAPLARLLTRVYTGPKGLTVAMSNGLLAFFGDATRPHAKWLSLARVLADPSSAGAAYVDVRMPERPAAGFPAGVTPPTASSSEGSAGAGEHTSTTESTVGALAAGLNAGGGASTTSTPSTPSAAESSTSAPGQSEASTTTHGQAGSQSSHGSSEPEGEPGG
jgi:cell division protein FtsQ